MAPGRSNLFTVTLGNMRQYMKEHQVQQPPRRQLVDLRADDLRLAPPVPAETGDKTIQLFPARPATVPRLSKDLPVVKEKAQLTMLYQEQVYVFDDVPVEKVKSLMQLAGKWSASKPPPEGGSPASTVLLKQAADLPLEDLLDMNARRTASVRRLLHKRQYGTPDDYADQRVAGENEPVDFKAMNDQRLVAAAVTTLQLPAK